MSDAVQPRHTVSVAAVVVGEDGRVLAIRRRDNGAWQPPGGILEFEEEIEEGLRREVLEETGLEVWPITLTGLYKHIDLGVLALVYLCGVAPGATLESTDEASEIRWMTVDEAERLMDDVFYLRIRDALDYDLTLRNAGPPVRHHDGETVLQPTNVGSDLLPGGANGAGGLEGAGHAVGVGLTVAGGEHGHVEVGEALE